MIDVDDLKFNELSEDERITALVREGRFRNPFDLPKDTPMMNPFTLKIVNGTMKDGVHVMHNPMNGKIFRKVLVENNEVVKAWDVSDNNTWRQVK